MEILTLVKANIRHKKGSFVSIIILMMIISIALLSILSVQDNINHGIMKAHERLHTGNIVSMINKKNLSEELLDKIKNHRLVGDVVRCVDTLPSLKITYNNTEYSNNQVFFQETGFDYRLFNADKTGYLDKMPELKQGECYIPQGMQTNLSCKIGDTLTLTTFSGDYDFKISGIIEDPILGASVIGWKNTYISHADFQKIYQELEAMTDLDENICTVTTQLFIYKADDCKLTDGQFARQLNLDTGFSDMSYGTLTKEMSTHYTYLFPQIVCSILIVFVLLLVIAVVIIMCHSVSTGIEMEYTTLGVMKSQGFTKGKIRIILGSQYLLAQIIGTILGIFPAIPLCRAIGHVFQPITGIVPLNEISIGKCTLIITGILFISILCMLVITRKVTDISPMRAICGGRREIYFDSRLKAPISRNLLSPSLALRQFTSNKRQYVGMLAIVSMLVFFMTTMMVLGNVITATSAWESMGFIYTDVDITFEKKVDDSMIADIEKSAREYTDIESFYHLCGNYYFSVDGEQIMCCISSTPEETKAILEGRIPLYDNEIVMTEIAAENMGLKVGDKVTVGYHDKKDNFIISGLNQSANDAGVNISMTQNAAKKLCNPNISYIGCVLSDRSEGKALADLLNETYGDYINADFTENLIDETYELAIDAMTAVVYVFSTIFAIVVVHMVCSKAFLRERRDIGIYKAIGFTSNRLRLQFMVRFLIVALIGAAIGSGLAAAFSENLLSAVLRMIGISNFHVPFHFFTFAVPITMICVCFCLFSFLEAGRIKKVEVTELIIE